MIFTVFVFFFWKKNMKKFSKWKIYFLFIYNNYYTHLKLLISFYFFCIFLLFLVVSEIHSYFNKNVVCFILFINFFLSGGFVLVMYFVYRRRSKNNNATFLGLLLLGEFVFNWIVRLFYIISYEFLFLGGFYLLL